MNFRKFLQKRGENIVSKLLFRETKIANKNAVCIPPMMLYEGSNKAESCKIPDDRSRNTFRYILNNETLTDELRATKSVLSHGLSF